jgi:hypothetical protein
VRKRYRDALHVQRALAHHHYLLTLGARVPTAWRLPEEPTTLVMGSAEGQHPYGQTQLELVAAALGGLHQRALTSTATAALPGFVEVRQRRLAALRAAGTSLPDLGNWEKHAGETPNAIYKDTNRRNVLVSGATVTWLDFDDLTQAPPGYDLAKLIVSAAMTDGHSPDVGPLLDAYCTTLRGPSAIAATRRNLGLWLTMNGALTAGYVGRGGYRHSWRDIVGSGSYEQERSASARGGSL